MSPIAFILGLFLAQNSFAATFDVPVKEGDRLVIKGLEAQVQLVSQPGAALRVSGVEEDRVEGGYTVEKKGNVIQISMVEPSGKRNWMAQVSKPSNPLSAQVRKIEITGVNIPAEIHLRSGVVTAQRWGKDLKATLIQGRFTSLGGKGTLQVSLQKGDVNIQEHTGKVVSDVYSGNVALKDITGDVETSLFSGVLGAEKLKGFSELTIQQATAKVNQSVGTLQFENGKGSLTVQGQQGRIEGQNAEGNVSITMNLDSEVDVRGKAGRVTVQSAANSGATVNLFTVDGDIFVPKELRVVKLSSEKSVRGKLRGESARGNIFVRGQETSIVVK
jgi:hypothetical protein